MGVSGTRTLAVDPSVAEGRASVHHIDLCFSWALDQIWILGIRGPGQWPALRDVHHLVYTNIKDF